MNKLTTPLFTLLLILPLLALPQEASKTLSTRDCVSPAFFPRGLAMLSWRADGDTYTYLDTKTQALIEGTIKGDEKPLLTLKQLDTRMGGGLKRFPGGGFVDQDTYYFIHENTVYNYLLSRDSLFTVNSYPAEAKNLEVGPDLELAYTVDYNLYVSPGKEKSVRQVTRDASRELVYGEAAHRSEFGITKGLFWSPKGDKLAFYRMDQRMVTDFPLVDYTPRIAEAKPDKYPMAGEASHHVLVGIYHVDADTVVYLKTGEPAEQYLTNITWSPDEMQVYVAVLNRDQNEMKLNVYDAWTGELSSTLFTETNPKYVEPEHGPIFIPGKSDQFLWYSERNGYNHLYQYQTDGTLIKQVTQGNWEVLDVLGFDETTTHIFLMTTEVSPLEQHAYQVELSSGKRVRLTETAGVHSCSLSKNGEYLIDSYSNLETPKVTQILKSKNGKDTATLHTSPNPLEGYQVGDISLFSLKAKDGTDLYCRLIKPTDFDSTKKYPVILYTYGGPHAQLVTNSWQGGASLFFQYLAEQGYVVFTLDNRGSPHRGLAFEQAVFRNLGTLEIEDQMTGVEWLKQQSYVDADRLGVHGWSYGGFMTTSLMLRKPGTFKVGVAGGPVIDWKYYEVMYTERYMDRPQDNPQGYKTASLLNYADQLQGKLLIIQGLQDNTVVPQHCNQFVRACVEKGVLIDYFPYPTHEHNVRGIDRAHLYAKIFQYFKDYL